MYNACIMFYDLCRCRVLKRLPRMVDSGRQSNLNPELYYLRMLFLSNIRVVYERQQHSRLQRKLQSLEDVFIGPTARE